MRQKKNNSSIIHILNKKARLNYEILEEIESGIILKGTEVKSIRAKKVNLLNSFAIIKKGEVYLINMQIDPYENASYFNHDPKRSRKLLLKKKEIYKLEGKMKGANLVLIPLKIYFKKHVAKVLLGIGKGKKKHDKRSVLKERDTRKEMERELKSYSRKYSN